MSAGGVAMQSSSAGGGIMVDGMRIGPPPDMPSLLLSNRIVYLGTPIASQVTELTNSDSLEVKVTGRGSTHGSSRACGAAPPGGPR